MDPKCSAVSVLLLCRGPGPRPTATSPPSDPFSSFDVSDGFGASAPFGTPSAATANPFGDAAPFDVPLEDPLVLLNVGAGLGAS